MLPLRLCAYVSRCSPPRRPRRLLSLSLAFIFVFLFRRHHDTHVGRRTQQGPEFDRITVPQHLERSVVNRRLCKEGLKIIRAIARTRPQLFEQIDRIRHDAPVFTRDRPDRLIRPTVGLAIIARSAEPKVCPRRKSAAHDLVALRTG